MAIGAIVSFTVTVEVQVDTLLLLSVTVRITGTGALVLLQLKLFLSMLSDLTPQASLEPLFTESAVMVAWPEAFK